MDYFDKAINDVLDGIERNVVDQVREAASAALEEYPSQEEAGEDIASAGERGSHVFNGKMEHYYYGRLQKMSASVDWAQAAEALAFWRSFDIKAGPSLITACEGSFCLGGYFLHSGLPVISEKETDSEKTWCSQGRQPFASSWST